jgi:hypothetical protein
MLALAGRPPVVVELKGAGHGIDSVEHRDRAYPILAGFLAQFLGVAAPSPTPAPAGAQ